ncbi:D-fructose-6-phosphate amidotransferase [Photobacterium sp. DNB23_23_1]
MDAYKLYLRDLLGIGLVISAVLVVLGFIFCLLAALNFFTHEEVLANTYLHEALPLFVFLLPSLAIARFINRPRWIHDVEEYQLESAKKFSQSH